MATLSTVSQGRITVEPGGSSRVARISRSVCRRFVQGERSVTIRTPFPDGTSFTGPQITSSSGMYQRVRYSPQGAESNAVFAALRANPVAVQPGSIVSVTARGTGANQLLASYVGTFVTASVVGIVVDMHRTGVTGMPFDFNNVLGRHSNQLAADFWGIYYEVEIGNGCITFQTECINVPNVRDNTLSNASSRANRQVLIVDGGDSNRIETADFDAIAGSASTQITGFTSTTQTGRAIVTANRNGADDISFAIDLTGAVSANATQYSGRFYTAANRDTSTSPGNDTSSTTFVAPGGSFIINDLILDNDFRLRRQAATGSFSSNWFLELNPFSQANRSSPVDFFNRTPANVNTALTFENGGALETAFWRNNISASIIPSGVIGDPDRGMIIDVDKSLPINTVANETATTVTTSDTQREALFLDAVDFSVTTTEVDGVNVALISTTDVEQVNHSIDATTELPVTTTLSFDAGLQTIQWDENITATVVTPSPGTSSSTMNISVDKSPELFTATAGTGAAGFTETSHTTSSNNRDGLFFNAADFSISQETVGGTATNVISTTASAGGVSQLYFEVLANPDFDAGAAAGTPNAQQQIVRQVNNTGSTITNTSPGTVPNGSNIWTINHALTSQFVQAQVYQGAPPTRQMVIPDEITIINSNQIQISFDSSSDVNGFVVITG